MTAMAIARFPARRDADRNAFLVFVGLVWIGILSGFGTDSYRHVLAHGLDYPLIVHVHAVTFVSYLLLFTVQVMLIRSGRADIHRKLGVAGAALAGAMLLIGPSTALVVDAAGYAARGETPEFLAVQLGDILAFAGLTGAGLLLRNNAAAHKRLMLLGLFYISDAGFARFLNPVLTAPLGEGRFSEFAHLFLCPDLLMLGLGLYDWITRRRLHPAYMVGLVWILAIELSAASLLHSEAWKALTLHMIGH
jgi:hypothetical protein